MFFQQFHTPEEIEQMRASQEAASHDINRLFGELDETQLKAVAMIFDGISMSEEPVRVASYFAGRAATWLQTRFDICAACGKNHNEDIAVLLGPPGTDKKSETTVPEHIQARRRLDATSETATRPYTEIGSIDSLSGWEREVMAEYGIDDLRDEDTGQLVGFICINCQFKYPSIQDRIRDEPKTEGCRGCHIKSAHG